MTKFMDYMISPFPIRITDLKVEKSKLHIQSLTITEMGHLPGRTMPRKHAAFDSWALAYIAGGCGSYQVNDGAVQSVEKGNLFFVYPGAVFHYGPGENGFWDEYYIRFEGNRIQEWLANWLLETDSVKQIGWSDLSVSKIEIIFSLIESGVPANVDRASLLLESLLFEWILIANEPQQKGTKQSIIQVIDDLSGTLYQPLDADKIAARNHISIPTLRRMVSQYTGYPLNEYVHRLKIAEAKRLLLNTDLQIKDVSDALCYQDAFYFSRLFKKYAGMSPNHYRKNR